MGSATSALTTDSNMLPTADTLTIKYMEYGTKWLEAKELLGVAAGGINDPYLTALHTMLDFWECVE